MGRDTHASSSQEPAVGFIGLGAMGSRMARRILDAGYPLTVYNRHPGPMQPLAQAGARVARSPCEVGAASEWIILMLSDDAAVREVATGEDGLLAGARPDSVMLDMSTVLPATSRWLADAARDRGVRALDAPVSGSTPQAEQGALVIFVGGDEAVFEQCRPLLEVLGHKVDHMGGAGCGSTMKLVVNTLLGDEMQAIAEAIALGQKGGLAKPRLLEVLGQTTSVAPAHAPKLRNAAQEEYPPAFSLALMHKDFGLILQLAASLAVPMPATAVAGQMCAAEEAAAREGTAHGAAEEDFSAVIRLMEQLAGV